MPHLRCSAPRSRRHVCPQILYAAPRSARSEPWTGQNRGTSRGDNLALVPNPCALRRRTDCWCCSGHQGGGVDAVLRPLPTKMRSADLGVPQNRQRGRELRARRPLLGRLQSQKKGLGGDRGRPEEEKYGIATIAHDR